MIMAFEESLVHVWYPITDWPFQVNDLTKLETHFLQIGAVDLCEGMHSSDSTFTKMGLDGGWQIVYQAKLLDIHLWALNVSRQYQRSRRNIRLSQRRNRWWWLVSIGIIQKDDIDDMWGWAFLLHHHIEARQQNRWFRDNGMSRNWVKFLDIWWHFKCRIDWAAELPYCP